MWRLESNDSVMNGGKIHYLASLSRHERSVNCVRFSPNGLNLKIIFLGNILASSGDGGLIILWRMGDKEQAVANGGNLVAEEEEDNEENWQPICVHRTGDGTSDLYDLSWHPTQPFLAVASTDNSIYFLQFLESMTSGNFSGSLKLIKVVKDHQHFVQGISWDPFGQFCASASCDRSFKVMITPITHNSNAPKMTINSLGKLKGGEDEGLVSFFRRLAFTTDGGILVLPGFINDSHQKSIALLYRNSLNKSAPNEVIALPASSKPVIGIRSHPRLFTSDDPSGYRCIFAAISLDSVYIFDTRQLPEPIYTISGLHYGQLTDAAWSANGLRLYISSTDGFCSYTIFEEGDFCSEALTPEEQQQIMDTRHRAAEEAWNKRIPPHRKKSKAPTDGGKENLKHQQLILENSLEAANLSSDFRSDAVPDTDTDIKQILPMLPLRIDHGGKGEINNLPVKRKVELFSVDN
jgi:chromatin assembly factor 1 subunit B